MASNRLHVVLAPRALRSRGILLEGIASRFSPKVAASIKLGLQDLPIFPLKWPSIETRKYGQVRKVVVEELTVILYQVKDENILVLDKTDARSNWNS